MSSNPLFIRLHLDEDVHPDLADLLRQDGFDCQSAVETGMLNKSDEEQLTYATSQGRCIMSFNVKDFAALAQQWAQINQAHSGIIVTQQVSRRSLGSLHRRILHLLNSTAADEMHNVFRYL